MSRFLNVASLHHGLHTVHPLPRASILYLQGCLKGRTDPCPGCANQDLWSDEERWLVEPAALARLIVRHAASPAFSISGGEPLDQHEPLCTFLDALNRARFSLFMWTGLEIEEVRGRSARVLQYLDFLVTGPYKEEMRIDGVPFVSSSNQQFHCLTERAANTRRGYAGPGQYEIIIPKDRGPAISLGVDISVNVPAHTPSISGEVRIGGRCCKGPDCSETGCLEEIGDHSDRLLGLFRRASQRTLGSSLREGVRVLVASAAILNQKVDSAKVGSQDGKVGRAREKSGGEGKS